MSATRTEECTVSTEQRASSTPAPWMLERNDNREEYSILATSKNPGAIGYYEIATMDFGFNEPFESQQHANARLIAAAPDLLAFANAYRESLVDQRECDLDAAEMELLNMADAVIAKVEGRS